MHYPRPRQVVTVVVAILATLSSLPLQAATPIHLSSQRFGGPSTDRGYSVVADAAGNVYVTGYFAGSVDFGGGALVSVGNSADIFVAKFNAAGVHQWSLGFGDFSTDLGQDIAVDASGNVYVTGRFVGSVNFGGGALVSAGGMDIFLAKFNASGVHQWSQRYGSNDPSAEEGLSLALDAAGNVYVTGYFAGTVNFGGGNLVSAGTYDMFLAKYNSSGVHQWSKRFGNTQGDVGYSVAIDASGSVLVTGYFSQTVDFGGGNLVSAGSFDVFVAKFSSSGSYQWTKQFGGTGPDEGVEVAVDVSGNVLATGVFFGTVNMGGGNLVSAGNEEIFLVKYNASGVHQWSQRFGSTDSDVGFGVVTDGVGSVFVTGFFRGTVNFGGGALVSAGNEDIYLAKYDAGGAHLWSKAFGSSNGEIGHAVAMDPLGNVLFTGYFNQTVDFGGGNLVSAGSDEIVVARYAPYSQGPAITDIKDIGNDQGRLVKIHFVRSTFDNVGSPSPIVQYEAYRRDAAPPSTSSPSNGAAGTSGGVQRLAGWTQVGAVAAHGEGAYGIDVPTIGDSTITQGPYYSSFLIRAATSNPVVFYDSDIDSGYSLDNLAPSVPENFTYTAGIVAWEESNAADFDYFTVYGSNTDDFGAAIVVDYSVDPTMDVTGSPYQFYFVTATDFSGNEGKPARVNTLSGVGGTPKTYVLSVSNYPNPFNPRTTVSYTVPARGPVTVSIYDARGSRVATLVNSAEHAAGAYTTEWNGRSVGGATVSSGVYFARIEQNGSVRSKKMVMLK